MTISPLLLRAPDILRAAGCEVVEYEGWKERGRPWTFTPKGLTLHHDGSPKGPADPPKDYARFLFEIGRPGEGIPAPLCQFWIDYYGRWWIGAAGGANHALGATGWGAIRPYEANTLTAGVEMDNTTDEPTTDDQWQALHRGVPALFREFGWDPSNALVAHKEVDAGRKSDPDDVDMPDFRAYVIHALDNPDGGDWFDMASMADLEAVVDKCLNKGTGNGQHDWPGTVRATLKTAQDIWNHTVPTLPVGTSVIKLADHPAQWYATAETNARRWIESQEEIDQLGVRGFGFDEVELDDKRWTYTNVNGHVPDGWPLPN